MAIKGMGSIKKLLKNLRRDSQIATQKGVMRAARLIEADAKSRVPVGQGELQRSIAVEQTEDTTYIFSDKPYAAYQEFGTGHLVKIPQGFEDYAYQFFVNGEGRTGPQPFLFPAYFKHKEKIIPFIDEEIQKVLDKYL